MTRDHFLALCTYVRACADVMGLKDWRIQINLEPPEDDGATAAIAPVYGRRYAELRFCEDFNERMPTEQRQTVAHELIHCHLDELDTVLNTDTLTDIMGKPAFHLLHAHHHTALENATDALAEAIAPMLPLPDLTIMSAAAAEAGEGPWILSPTDGLEYPPPARRRKPASRSRKPS
jgi:hypothetical protein